jgi:putative molybdopterin biosynthesis protein
MKETQAFTPEEVSQILKITKYTVYEMVKRGELPAYRVGNKIRIDPRDLEAYMNQGKKSEAGNLSTTQFEQPLPLKMPGLETAPQKTGGILICGQDILLDILARYVENHPQGCRVLRQNVGSFAGLLALYQGRADMAAVHLWDGDTGSYNTPYVRHFLPGIPTVIIHLACRMQGFYVAKGNPKNIQGWDDLKRDDLVYINREPGCGPGFFWMNTL